ncbi:MAG: N-acetylmuramoyl-L-alanine amidase [Elainellaceae cyanobacterium]
MVGVKGALGFVAGIAVMGVGPSARAEEPALNLVYPPNGHETTAAQIFFIGTAAAAATINGQPVAQSGAGHFAPSLPLALGENRFVIRAGDAEQTLIVVRNAAVPALPEAGFAEGSLFPTVAVARQPGETLCFEAIAPAESTVSLTLAGQTIPLLPQTVVTLPPNSAVLTGQNGPVGEGTTYGGCLVLSQVGLLGPPRYRLETGDQPLEQAATGTVEVLPAVPFQVATVTAPSGTARTGPSTTYSRLTPLPTGTQAAVTGREGDWWRLDYGAWIRASDVAIADSAVPPRSLVRSVLGQELGDRTEILFPLQVPVPVSVAQGSGLFTLTLHNTTAQTDTIRLDNGPVVERLDWSQPTPDQVQYRFSLKSAQAWGYSLRYEGANLVLTLRHPPELADAEAPLAGTAILLDPGHGSPEDLGARGPTGLPEKDVTLAVSQQLRQALEARGATVYMTREGDDDLFPSDRVAMIESLEPTLALSVHYNALPDEGDAVNTAGIGMFWYHAQARDLAAFLHDHLVETLDRPSYGLYWNNLALTRPAIAPSVLLELGFMINPEEFEWIVDPVAQAELVEALAAGIEQWVASAAPSSREP